MVTEAETGVDVDVRGLVNADTDEVLLDVGLDAADTGIEAGCIILSH